MLNEIRNLQINDNLELIRVILIKIDDDRVDVRDSDA